MGVFEAIARIILGWHKAGQLQGWLRLLFGIGFSFFVTFNSVAGASLAAGSTWSVGVGRGMIAAAAMALIAFFRANKELTKDIVVAVPQSTVRDQFDPKTGQGPMVSVPPEKK